MKLELGNQIPAAVRIQNELDMINIRQLPLTQYDVDQYIITVLKEEIEKVFGGITSKFFIGQYLQYVCEDVYEDKNYFQLSASHQKELVIIRHEYTWVYQDWGDNRFELRDNDKTIWIYRIKNMMCPSYLPFHARKFLSENAYTQNIVEEGYEWDNEKGGK